MHMMRSVGSCIVRGVGVGLLSLVMGATGARGVTGYWTNNVNANWTNSASWAEGIIPNYAGDVVYITNNITAARGVNITSPVTNGLLYVGDADGSHSFSISSTGNLTFDNAGAGAALTMTASSTNTTVNVAGVSLIDGLSITNESTASILTISSPISGNAAISLQGGPGVTLSGSNTFNGGVALQGGTFKIGHNYAMGTGALVINGGILDVTGGFSISNNIPQFWNADFSFVGSGALNLGAGPVTLAGDRSVSVNASTLTVGGSIDDGGNSYSLTKNGAGVLALAGTNTFDGGIILNAGELAINKSHALGLGTLVINGGALNNATSLGVSNANNNAQIWNADFTWPARSSLHLSTGNVTLNGSLTITNPLSVYGSILTVGGSIDDGENSYSLTYGGVNGGLALAGSNTYDGGTVLTGGKFYINNGRALGTGPLTLYGGLLDNNSGSTVTNENHNAQFWNANFSYYGSATLHMGTGAVLMAMSLTVSNVNNLLTTDGVISDGGSGYTLTKVGNGTLGLGGNNTYSGGTVLNAGALQLNHPGALGPGTFTINGGTLNSAVTGTFVNANNNAQLWNGNFNMTLGRPMNLGTGSVTLGQTCTVSPLYATLTVGGVIDDGGQGYGLIKGGGNTLELTGENTYSGDTTVSTGTLALAGSGSIANSAAILVAASSTVSVIGRTDGTLTLVTNQYLRGNGAVRGAVTNFGIVAPGLSAGRLSVTGTYSQVGSLEIELGGTTPGIEHDVLGITSIATLGGALEVTTIDGFTPVPGNTFTVLTASAVSGTFATTNLPAGSWTVDYQADKVVLTMTGEGGGPVLGVSPESLSFGSVRVGESSDLVFTVTNSGTAQLEGTATVAGISFAVNAGSPFSLAAGASAAVTIRFTPTETSSYLGDVTFLSNGGGSTNAVGGTGYVQSIGTNTSMTLVGGQPTFAFTLVSGALYRVQASTNLVDGAGWVDVTAPLTNHYPNGIIPPFSESDTTNYPRRAYRITSP